MTIEAMKQALEALDCIYSPLHVREINKVGAAMIALRQAIAEAERAQPVACKHEWFRTGAMEPNEMRCIQCGQWGQLTAPPPRKPWVGLTGDEVNEFAAGCHLGNSVQGAIRKAEARLKEKNT
jgi:hypothetical protein